MANVYTSAMGMISFQNKLDVAGNNIANVKTNGFKKDRETFSVFEEGLRRLVTPSEKVNIGPVQNQVHIDNIQTNFNQGLTEITNRKLDLTLMNQRQLDNTENILFFEVSMGGETFLTRDGHFQVDEANNLSLANGAFVLDVNGNQIRVPNPENIGIDEQGNISDNETGEFIAQIQIRSINENNTGYLQKTEHNMFEVLTLEELQENFGPLGELLGSFDNSVSLQKILKNRDILLDAQNTGAINIFNENAVVSVKQQMLEQSNVDIAKELNEILIAQKGIQANSKAVTTFDKINEKDANEIGV